MFQKILITCIGNICRSPTAEYLFRHRLGEGSKIQVSSAGLGALTGHPIDASALELLREHGIDGSAHRARQLDRSLLRSADLVLAMERDHVGSITRMAPEASGKVFLLDRWLVGQDIPDPFRQSRPAFEHVYTLIDNSVNSWMKYL
ncbi:MAG TPA: low molecular weight protein-tyrosine-phosphatase [Luteibacter sp.]|jgi:protein-tyrosine phosphatase|uniref:low molecular weight protein-tyrosine-phosphatase n=1 Tax=Luteibacter sp. TaxID=1886636 RepID=UPI002F3EAB89